MIDLSVVIVNWNTRDELVGCVQAATDALGEGRPALSAEILVVDNGSTDDSVAAVRERFPELEIICLPKNVGYAAGNNAALRDARGEFLLLLNTDATVTRQAIEAALAVLRAEQGVGVVGIQLCHPDGRLQNSVHAFPGPWTELVPRAVLERAHPARYPSKRVRIAESVDVDAVLGAALFVRHTAMEQVGLLDEGYFFFLEETDWCWRMRDAGWRVVHVPSTPVVHGSGVSSKRRHAAITRIEYHRSLYRFLRLHRGPMALGVVVAIRIVRTLGTLALLAPLAILSRRQRSRFGERAALLGWHVRGCPAHPGLADVAAEGRSR